jgi:hypothetical protein
MMRLKKGHWHNIKGEMLIPAQDVDFLLELTESAGIFFRKSGGSHAAKSNHDSLLHVVRGVNENGNVRLR